MRDLTKLSQTEREILNYIDRVGYTSPIVIEAKFRCHRNTVSNVLNRLWHGQHIERPLKGFLISIHWSNRNPHETSEICQHLGINIPKIKPLQKGE